MVNCSISADSRSSEARKLGRKALASGTTKTSYSSLIRAARCSDASVLMPFETTSVSGVSSIRCTASLNSRLPEFVPKRSWCRNSACVAAWNGLFPDRMSMRFTCHPSLFRTGDSSHLARRTSGADLRAGTIPHGTLNSYTKSWGRTEKPMASHREILGAAKIDP